MPAKKLHYKTAQALKIYREVWRAAKNRGVMGQSSDRVHASRHFTGILREASKEAAKKGLIEAKTFLSERQVARALDGAQSGGAYEKHYRKYVGEVQKRQMQQRAQEEMKWRKEDIKAHRKAMQDHLRKLKKDKGWYLKTKWDTASQSFKVLGAYKK